MEEKIQTVAQSASDATREASRNRVQLTIEASLAAGLNESELKDVRRKLQLDPLLNLNEKEIIAYSAWVRIHGKRCRDHFGCLSSVSERDFFIAVQEARRNPPQLDVDDKKAAAVERYIQAISKTHKWKQLSSHSGTENEALSPGMASLRMPSKAEHVRGDQLDYDFPIKSISRDLIHRFIEQHFSPEDIKRAEVVYLGSNQPKLEGEIYLSRLGISPDRVWCAEKSTEALPECRLGCEELGIHLFEGDVGDFLSGFSKSRSPKIISLDFHNQFSEANLEIVSKIRIDSPTILILNFQRRRETLETQGLLALKPAMEDVASELFQVDPATKPKDNRAVFNLCTDSTPQALSDLGVFSPRPPVNRDGVQEMLDGRTLKEVIVGSIPDYIQIALASRTPAILCGPGSVTTELARKMRDSLQPLKNIRKWASKINIFETVCVAGLPSACSYVVEPPPKRVCLEPWSYISKRGNDNCPMQMFLGKYDPAPDYSSEFRDLYKSCRKLLDLTPGRNLDKLSCRASVQADLIPGTQIQDIEFQFVKNRDLICSLFLSDLYLFTSKTAAFFQQENVADPRTLENDFLS